MTVLVDANVLLRNIEENHPQCAVARNALERVRKGGHELVLVPQVLYELWVVATRPVAQNGLGLTAERVALEIEAILKLHPTYEDEVGILEYWRLIVARYRILGKRAHDARLVAAMLRHGITHLLTFNAQDFTRFPEVAAILPQDAHTLPPA
ncbi:MAG: type II toxin-antitoxin system VapC family toxin [Pirellulales bacterium]|nr:type II toxin-antitoxin system VapC family toxin [Pirellulales bacterium]